MMNPQRQRLAWTLVGALVAAGLAYWQTFASIVDTWQTNGSFSHGFLIVPIALWLVWGKRHELAAVAWRPSWIGAALVALCSAAWLVSHGAGVRGLEQFAAVATIPAVTLAVLGWQAAWTLVFPLGFLLFAVPVGHALVPTLMNVSADVATWALRLTGVPIFRSGMYISIPMGDFEVARQCSGLNYVVTGSVLGVLYSYLTYVGWRKRLLSVLAFMIIPIIANGVRVYLTILISYLTDMRFGPGTEHVWFGRVFFIVVIFAMFWIGRRWQDRDLSAASVPELQAQPPVSVIGWLPVAVTALAIVSAPLSYGRMVEMVESRLAAEVQRLKLPPGSGGWTGPVADVNSWRPLYSGARVDRAGTYRDASGEDVDVFVGVYGIGTSGGAEMINYNNQIFPQERISLGNEEPRVVPLPDGRQFIVREQPVRDASGDHLVWYWFMVGDRSLTSPYAVKAEEARAFFTGGAVTERVITLSTPADGEAGQRLERFVADHVACVSAGFAFEACGG